MHDVADAPPGVRDVLRRLHRLGVLLVDVGQVEGGHAMGARCHYPDGRVTRQLVETAPTAREALEALELSVKAIRRRRRRSSGHS